jgi:hypothetical protein
MPPSAPVAVFFGEVEPEPAVGAFGDQWRWHNLKGFSGKGSARLRSNISRSAPVLFFLQVEVLVPSNGITHLYASPPFG